MFNFLQTQQGLQVTAFFFAAIIVFAFLFGTHSFKNKKQVFVLAPAEDYNLLTARDCFTIISAVIESSRDIEELKKAIRQIEAFKRKKFRFSISRSERKRLYDSLYLLYCQKELELEQPIAVELCAN